MAKFDMDKIKGKSNINESDKEVIHLTVGNGLLNATSQKQKTTVYVRHEEIRPNPMNEMSKKNIEELAQLIDAGGLDQPLVLCMDDENENYTYRIITGERRYWAIDSLIKDGKWNEEHLVEAKIKDINAIDLPLPIKDKELFALLMTNQNRVKTDADLYFEAVSWKRIIRELRKEGRSLKVVGYDEDGNPIKRELIKIGEDQDGNAIEQDITGMKTQEIVAQNLGTSHSQIALIEKIENKGIDDLKRALKEEKVGISVASKIASMTEPAQEEFLKETLEQKKEGEIITQSDIRKKEYEKKENIIDNNFITEKRLKMDLKHIIKALKETGGIQLEDKEYLLYIRQIDSLKKLFVK